MLIEALDRVLRGAALAAAVLAIALLAGCGGDDDDASDSAAGAESVATGAEQSPADFGEEAESAERDAAGAAVQGFLSAWGAGDWAKACSLMAASTKQNVELFAGQYVKSQDCAEQLEALSEQLPAKMLPQPGRIEVTAVRVGDAGGFVLYRDADGTKYAFPVLQEDSAWKVAALVGSKLP
ncbi:MAG: hypothetical protein ACXWFN_12975 [Solirubrobacterales bacterium]